MMNKNKATSILLSLVIAFGMWLYVRYALTLTLLYCVLLFVIESLSLFDFPYLLLRIVSSTLLTFVLILCIDSLRQNREKRL